MTSKSHVPRFVLLAICLLSGCQQQMAKQPKYLPLEPSTFFADGRSARPLVPGTVARGHLQADKHLLTGGRSLTAESVRAATIIGAGSKDAYTALAVGLAGRQYVDTFPFPVTRQVLERGQQRFTIYCAVCHGDLGHGDGIVVRRGFTTPPTYHSDRLRAAPVGYFYDVITHGFGSMPDLAEQIPSRDRWAIIAYLRALQLSQFARLDDLPEAEKAAALKKLESN